MDFNERARRFYRARSSSASISTTTSSFGGELSSTALFNRSTPSILLQHLQTSKESNLRNSFNQALADKLSSVFTTGARVDHHHPYQPKLAMSNLLSSPAAAFYNNCRGNVGESALTESPLLAATLLREQQLYRASFDNLSMATVPPPGPSSSSFSPWRPPSGLPDEHHVSSTNVERRLRDSTCTKRPYHKMAKAKVCMPQAPVLLSRPLLPPPPPPPPAPPASASLEASSVAMAHQNEQHNSLAASMPLLSAYLRGERNLSARTHTHIILNVAILITELMNRLSIL